MSEQTLTHHGVMGMKWGVRRYQPYGKGESGRFLGKKKVPKAVQAQKDEVKKRAQTKTDARVKKNLESLGGMGPVSKKTRQNHKKAVKEHGYSLEDLKSIKTLEKLNAKTKSKEQIKMEEKYKSQGMHADEAAVAAYQNIQTKKVLLTVGAVVVTASVGYAAYKLHDDRIDKIIKSGDIIKTISSDSNPVRDAFYATNKDSDHGKYKGILAGTFIDQNRDAYQKTIKVVSDIKQASAKNAHIVLKDAVRDKNFTKDFDEKLGEWIEDSRINSPAMSSRFKQARESLNKGVVDRNVYEAFNTMLVDHSPKMQRLTDGYYDKLKEKGYNAIRDVNDSKYSGYMARNPIIVFGSKGKVEVADIEELFYETMAPSRREALNSNSNKLMIKQGAPIAAGIMAQMGATKIGVTKTKQVVQKNAVDRYRKENPGSTMSNTEITRMLERSRI